MAKTRRVRLEGILLGIGLAGLAVVLGLMEAGIAVARLRSVAVFLGVCAVVSIHIVVVERLLRRRVLRLRSLPIPLGVPLSPPLWIWFNDYTWLVWLGGALGAIPAGLGFPGVGVGILLTLLAFCGSGFLMMGTFMVRALTFEHSGLRVHLKSAWFFIPWAAIGDVEASGSESHQSTQLRIFAAAGVVDSVTPDTPKARSRVRLLLTASGPSDASLVFMPWTAGLDAPTLARAIREGLEGHPAQAN